MLQYISCCQLGEKSQKPYYIQLLRYHLIVCIQVSPSKELRAVHIEEDSMGVFHLYILPPKNAAKITINAARDNITKISNSVFPNISQYSYNSFVNFTKTLLRVLDNEASVSSVNYPCLAYSLEFLLYNLRLLGKSSNFMPLFVTITLNSVALMI